jgi:hypothetical protein
MKLRMTRTVAVATALPLAFVACDGPTASVGAPGAPDMHASRTGEVPRSAAAGAFALSGADGAGAPDAAIVVGAPPNALNRFPFGGALNGFAGSRYQQAYAAAAFATDGPILISGITFLDGQGTLAASTYSFHLSTITAGIDKLSNSDFDGNRGADNTLFAVVDLGGPAPPTLTITGSAPFLYDPAQGNLLLDIVISPRADPPAVPAAFAYRTDGAGIFSRYQDFGFGGQGLGLVTRFDLAAAGSEDPEATTFDDLMAAVRKAVDDRTLTGHGPGKSAPLGLPAWLNMLNAARHAHDTGNTQGACAQLRQILLRADGEPSPPDFVTGPAVPELADTIRAVRSALACTG